MSEAARIPFSETKAPESPERLHRGALRLIDISASTMANIGPAISFYFGFGFLVVTAGVASPLTIIVAGVAIALLGNTLSQFSRAHPSTGGFITFVGKTLRRHQRGDHGAARRPRLHHRHGLGLAMVRRLPADHAAALLHRIRLPVGIVWTRRSSPRSPCCSWCAAWPCRRRSPDSSSASRCWCWCRLHRVDRPEPRPPVRRAVRAEAHHQRVQRARRRFPARRLPVHRLGELGRAGRGDRTTRGATCGRAVFASIGIMVVSYLLFAYATVTGFDYNVTNLGGAAIPFISVAERHGRRPHRPRLPRRFDLDARRADRRRSTRRRG